MKSKTVYLDYAAATPLDRQVKLSMEPFFSELFYNPSASYLSAKSVSKAINQARSDIAKWLGSRPSEVVFTAGGTEANNLAISGVMAAYPGANLVISTIEHESVVKPAENYDHKKVPVSKQGVIDLDKLKKAINDQTVLVSVIYANNEIGSIQPIHKISKILNEIRLERRKSKNNLPIYLHTDACQAANYLDLHVSRIGVDIMTLNSGKIYGPKQFGGLYVSRKVSIKPQILGGGQEMGIRSGTENPASIVGFAKALDIAQTTRIEESRRLGYIQKYFIDFLLDKKPAIKINGSTKYRLPNNVNIMVHRLDNETMLMKLDEFGIECASGSACNANSDDLSPTLLAIGLTEKEVKSSLRFSMGRFTSKEDVKFTVEKLLKIIQ